MTDIRFINARLIDPEAGTETLGSLTVSKGLIAEISAQDAENKENQFRGETIDQPV